MKFCKSEGGGIQAPYTFSDLRRDNPQVSFNSETMRDLATLATYNVFPIVDTPPAYDGDTQILQKGRILQAGDDFVQQYTVQNRPSKLDNANSNRHPTNGELVARMLTDPDRVFDYYMAQVQELKIDKVAEQHNLMDVVPQRDGTYKRKGSMEKAATYAQIPGSPRRNLSNQLMSWRDRVWNFVTTRWTEVLGGARPPTWAELEAEIDLEQPEP